MIKILIDSQPLEGLVFEKLEKGKLYKLISTNANPEQKEFLRFFVCNTLPHPELLAINLMTGSLFVANSKGWLAHHNKYIEANEKITIEIDNAIY